MRKDIEEKISGIIEKITGKKMVVKTTYRYGVYTALFNYCKKTCTLHILDADAGDDLFWEYIARELEISLSEIRQETGSRKFPPRIVIQNKEGLCTKK